MARATALTSETSADGSTQGRLRLSVSNRQRAENRTAYIFMLPWLLGFFLFTAGPMLVSLYLSFTSYDLLSSPEWVGLNNFTRMIGRDNRWRDALQVTFIYVGLTVPLRLMFALFIALILNRAIRGVSFYRAIYYLPSLLGGSVAIAVLWRELFGLNGLVNQVLALFGIEGRSWIGHPDTALGTLIILGVWQFGSPMIIFLAGLKQIPTELYEASQIDGANRLQQFLRLTLPLLTPIIFFNLVMQTISSFQSFTPAFIVSGGTGGPADATLFYTLYLYQQGFTNLRMGYASALAWILLLIVGALTAINFMASRFWVFYGDERK
jgi:multiple sugar transport system permease protein